MLSLLSGIRVVDMTRLIPGAYATAKLADMGADVIKVEQPPIGDYLRSIPPIVDGLGALHIALNRNKRSIAIDQRTPEGKATFHRLLKTADVFMESGRPGAAARVGADYESVRAVKPDIVYCSLSGFGQDGPYAQLPSHGANLDGAAGAVSLQVADDGSVTVPNIRVFVASQAGALHAAFAITSALVQRMTKGEGAFLDIGCWDAAVSWQYGNLTSLANTGKLFPGASGLGPKYGCYQTADAGWVFLGLIEPKFWRTFCAAAGREDLAERGDPSRTTDYGESDAALGDDLTALIASRSSDAWVEIAIREQLPIAPILRPDDLLTNPHAEARGSFVTSRHPETGGDFRMVSLPVKVAGQQFEVTRVAPRLGEHTEEILAELG